MWSTLAWRWHPSARWGLVIEGSSWVRLAGWGCAVYRRGLTLGSATQPWALEGWQPMLVGLRGLLHGLLALTLDRPGPAACAPHSLCVLLLVLPSCRWAAWATWSPLWAALCRMRGTRWRSSCPGGGVGGRVGG